MPDKEIPLIHQPGSEPFGQPVIDLAEVRIRMGYSDHKVGAPCKHHALIYNTTERRIWCEDCERTIDSFDAFMTVVGNFHPMINAAKHALKRAKDAEAQTITLRAAKVFDKAWRGNQMAVSCPHCSTGLLPEDFMSGGSQVSAEIERARRLRSLSNKESGNGG
jgi:ribosomal protein S27E